MVLSGGLVAWLGIATGLCLSSAPASCPQMCQKQCRDENGFKCHLTSEGHKRQMEIFGQNPKRIIEGCAAGAAGLLRRRPGPRLCRPSRACQPVEPCPTPGPPVQVQRGV